MLSVPFSKVKVGTPIADMHYHWHTGPDNKNPFWIQEPHRILKRISIGMRVGASASEMVRTVVGRFYDNKALVVADVRWERPNTQIIKAVWSYDDTTFGMMEIEVTVADED